MSNINRYSQFISEHVRKSTVAGFRSINEGAMTADQHAAAFAKHAKAYFAAHKAVNSSRAERDADYADKHATKMDEHESAAEEHAAQYHKLTGKKVTVNYSHDYADSHDKHPWNDAHVHDPEASRRYY